MIFGTTRGAATMLALAGLVAGGGSVATSAASVSTLYRPERLADGGAGHLVATAMHRSARPRIVVHPSPPYPAEEPGAIYGYAPGYYQLGRAGVLYGPYPLNPNAPIAELRY
jgi:hypothetical protein